MATNPNDWPTWLLGPKPSSNTSTATQPMSAQTPKPTGSMPQSTPSISTPSTPSYSSPSSTATAIKPPSSQSDGSGGIKMTRVGPNGEFSFTVANEDWAKFYENQGAARVGSMPSYTTYTPPTSFGVDSQGKPMTEQQWIGSGGLLGLSGKNEVNTAKLSNGSYLDTTNMTPQQVHAATLWDEVKAGKRSADSVAAILKGQGIDAYGNPVSGLYQGNNVYYASGYNAPMSAQAAKGSGASGASNLVYYPGMNGSPTNQPLTADNAKTISLQSGGSMPGSQQSGLTPSQQSAQDYIVKSGQWGTLDNYVQNNINRYLSGEISYDRLAADAQRVGYSIPPQSGVAGGGTPSGGNNVTQSGGFMPNQPDFRAIAEAEAARDLAGKQRVAGQQITGITNAFNRSNEILRGNRTLEDVSINNTLNPFSGRTAFAKGMVGRERTLADESAQGNFNTAIQGIQQGLADDQNTAAQWIIARAYQLEQDAANRAIQEAQLTGMYKGQPTLAGQGQILSNKGQQIANQLAQLQLQNYPESVKQQAQLFEQQLKTGQISLDTAEYQLQQLMDPNSITNRANELDLQMKQLEASYLPQEQKLKLQQLRKTIDNIGKVPPVSEYDKQMQQIKLDTARAELEKLQKGNESPEKLSAKDSTDNYNMIFDDLQSDGVDKNTARQLLQANRSFLTDSDYNKLNNWINDNL